MDSLLNALKDLWEVLLAALVFGAGMPALFAFGVRFWAHAETVDGDGRVRRNYFALVSAITCFVVIVVVVIAAILFIAKAFIAHQFGIHLFGQA
ncbi:hypothetical protein [Nocardia camponoti]|uniref:Uncharacterized protein n=1 Tax=Nocardia camponoti TaxID=1616106 RepID=A0A917QHR6_9NOCA|nr:hypothetical protein [Nocardia camponoti]GGK51332.1 hypothetical protein GCM10011591_23670 [Nocardia camponoti]